MSRAILEKYFDGLREACETFEKAAIDDIPDGMGIERIVL